MEKTASVKCTASESSAGKTDAAVSRRKFKLEQGSSPDVSIKVSTFAELNFC